VPTRSILRNDSYQHINQGGFDRPGTLSRIITATQLELKRVFTTEDPAKLRNQSHNNYVFFHLNTTATTNVHIITSTQHVTILRSKKHDCINHYILTQFHISIQRDTRTRYVGVHITLPLNAIQPSINGCTIA